MFLAPDGTKPLDFTLGSVFGCGIQPNAQQENLFLNRLLYLAATGYGLRKRSLNPADELVNTAVTLSAKRPRVEVIPTPTACILPSRVLHVRNLPADTTEIDIVKLAMPFGPIANLVLTKKTGQANINVGRFLWSGEFALIEMTSVDVAAKMLEYYQFYPPFFHGSEESAILQFSKYQNLELTGISRPVSEAIAMANEHFLRCVAENPTRPRVLRVFLEPAPHNHLNYMDYFKEHPKCGSPQLTTNQLDNADNKATGAVARFQEEFSSKIKQMYTLSKNIQYTKNSQSHADASYASTSFQ
ncbi:hypothetical protein ACTXT7_001066 [Hymenolepis weldensis]